MLDSMSEKIKLFLKKPVGLFLVVCVLTLLIMTVLFRWLNHQNSQQLAQSLQNQQSQQVLGDVHYTTEETLRTLTGETANIASGLAAVKASQKQFRENSQAQLQAALVSMQKTLQTLTAENAAFKQTVLNHLKQNKSQNESAGETNPETGNQSDSYPLGDNNLSDSPNSASSANAGQGGLVWYGDQTPHQFSAPAAINPSWSSEPNAALSLDANQSGQTQPLTAAAQSDSPIPVYTIPANTILTGVLPEQPIVGVIPVNGTVVNPQGILFMVGSQNLAANNWHLPMALKGIQGHAICQGVFVWFNHVYANCKINSLTFIFHDGRIATARAKQQGSFGHLTTLYGNPNIPGVYHGNAGYAGLGTGIFTGIQGFGDAYASQQQQITGLGNNQVAISYKNAFAAGLGSAGGAAGEYLNQWWQNLLSSTTNFVYVPNWDPKNHQLLVLNAVITQPVDINYNPKGRKVADENANQSTVYNGLN